MKILWRIYQIYRPDLDQFFFALGLLLVSTVGSLLKPWPLALLVDCVVNNKTFPPFLAWLQSSSKAGQTTWLALAMLLLYTLQGALSAWQHFVTVLIGLRGLRRVRNDLFVHLERLSLRFHKTMKQGDLIYRASWDTFAFQTFFQQGIFIRVQAHLSLLLMIGIMFWLNVPLTLILVAFVPILILAMQIFGKKMKAKGLIAHQADSGVTTLFQRSIVTLALIQSYTREREEQLQFEGETLDALQKRRSQHGWEIIYGLAIAAGFAVATTLIAWVGIQQVLLGKLTLGELLIFLAYLAQVYEPLNQLSHVGATTSDAAAGMERVFEILDSNDLVNDSPRARPLVWKRPSSDTEVKVFSDPKSKGAGRKDEVFERERQKQNQGQGQGQELSPLRVRGEIEFDRVGFFYSEPTPILQEISFCLRAGESAALIGPSGAGKTTLLQLLPRFYDPTSGVIRLDGVDLRNLRVHDLRSAISLVLQEPILLPSTISENIAYGRPTASATEVMNAARAAHAHEFITRLPDAYDTRVGEGFVHLSVGEKQRINLARAFLKDSPILLLDEPTNALDGESEELVVHGLGQLMKNRTTLMVAHRMSTIRQVQKVITLKEGKVRVQDQTAP